MSMGNSYGPENDELRNYGLRLFAQLVGFVLALSAFALWLLPGAGEGLSLGRLGLSLLLLLTGMGSVLGSSERR